jgi:16S rRNA (cytosine967-C5)-methyltransferase
LAHFLDRDVEDLDPEVLEVLRLGAYQALYMDSVPVFAAVSESVAQVRQVAGQRPTGLVNAVLRRVAEAGDGPERFPDPQTDPAAFLSTWGSHPRWLLDRWLSRLPLSSVQALVEHDNRRPPTFLVALDLEVQQTLERLQEVEIDADPVSEGPTCVRLAPGTSPATALSAVPASIIQDPAAGLVARYADLPPGTDVADLCAAPGGKALTLAAGGRRLIAADLSEARLRLVRENAVRTGRAVPCVVADALHPPFASIDAVVLDAPCSGTGTLSRHPDARWRLSPDDIDRFAVLQKRMLHAAAAIVRQGGWLVYSTCTLEPEENEQRIDEFLDRHTGFRLEPTDAVPDLWLDGSGRLAVTPVAAGHDGAFAARMRRIG